MNEAVKQVLNEVLSGERRVCASPGCASAGMLQPVENFYLLPNSETEREELCVQCSSGQTYATRLKRNGGVLARVEALEQLSLDEHLATAIKRQRARSVVAKYLPPASTFRCVLCGLIADEWHHHMGYHAPYELVVVPVCTLCHGILSVASGGGL